MSIVRYTFTEAQLRSRLLARLGGGRTLIAWRSGADQLLVDLRTLTVALGEGWLAVEFPVTVAGGAAAPFQLVFWLGLEGEGEGVSATCTVGKEPAGMSERWTPQLRRLCWEAVLDLLESAVLQAEKSAPGSALTLLGYQAGGGAGSGTVTVDVSIG